MSDDGFFSRPQLGLARRTGDRGTSLYVIPLEGGEARRVLAHETSMSAYAWSPEGTRVAVGDSKPYQVGIAALYRQLGIPVVPVALNSGLFWGRRKFVKRPGVIDMEILPPIPAGLKREAFMALLHERIEGATGRLVAGAQPQNR